MRYPLRPATWAENDGVATLDRDERLEDKRSHWVGRGHQSNDDANGARDFGDSTVAVEADFAQADLAGQLPVYP